MRSRKLRQRNDLESRPVRESPPARVSPAGFTFPELLIVLLFVSILGAMVVPNLEIVRYRMDGAARGTAAALVAAQRQAVARQHDVVVAFDTANRRLRIHQDRNRNGAIDGGEPTRMIPYDDGVVFGLGGAPALAGAAVVLDTETQGGLPVVRFIRNGSASEEGHVYLTSARAARAGRPATDARALEVDRATGRITWYSYGPHDWKKAF